MAGISLTELAARMGTSQPNLSKRLRVGRFTKEEIPVMEDAIVKAEKAVAEIIKNGVQSAMNKYNGK